MSIFYKHTGSPDLSISYLYGEHWNDEKGYIVEFKKGEYDHFFGGESWNLPVCQNCMKPYHQIFSLDLTDPKLSDLSKKIRSIPLIGCLNCSGSFGRFYYKIDDNMNITELHTNDTQHWVQDDDLKLPSPLPKADIDLIETDLSYNPVNEEKYSQLVESFGNESMCRILGAPLYLQNPIDYECPICKKQMKYVAQICSDTGRNIKSSDVEFNIGDIYMYYCYCDECHLIVCETQEI